MGAVDRSQARFEYRVWNPPGSIAASLRGRGRHTGRTTVRDCYVLIEDSEVNAKIRDDRIDVKRLVEGRDGFERWAPAWKSDAPFSRDATVRLFDEYGLPAPDGLEDALTVDDLVAVIRGHGHLDAAWVTKAREFFEIGGMSSEITEVTVDRVERTLSTIAIEGHDVEALSGLRSELGIGELENIAVDQAVLRVVRGRGDGD